MNPLPSNPPWASAMSDIDAQLQRWAQRRGGQEQHWPVLMREQTLRKAGYFDSFPQLVMTATACPDPQHEPQQLASTGWCLSPAVCYHAYAGLEGATIESGGGVRLSAVGSCFRNEEKGALQEGRRQVEFHMRELILIGDQEWIAAELTGVKEELSEMASSLSLEGRWQPASDPFFLPQAKGKAYAQRLLETKLEMCLPDGLAIASINRHGSFFGERFSIHTENGKPAHSACIAFGLERWASQTPMEANSNSNSNLLMA